MVLAASEPHKRARLARLSEEATMRSCSDVHNLLNELGVDHEIVQLPSHSKTAQRAASLLGVAPAEIVKSLIFYLDGAPTLVLVPGDATVDTVALACELGVRNVALARSQEVLKLTGYRPGAVPPCGLSTPLPAVADPRVFVPEVVYCGGGTTTTMLKIRSADLGALLKPRLASVAERRPARAVGRRSRGEAHEVETHP
jgi:prolyl-tRNA editing enzyme YbaK/EbsC (Cys-tRNA(Pro) deacylase)